MPNEDGAHIEVWNLVARFRDPNGHQIKSIRQLDTSEQASARDDAALVHRLTVGSGWNEVNDAADSFNESIKQWSRTSNSSSQELTTKIETSTKKLLSALAFYGRRSMQLDQTLPDPGRSSYLSNLRNLGWERLSSHLEHTNWTSNTLHLTTVVDNVPVGPGQVTSMPVLTPDCAEKLGLPNPSKAIYVASDIMSRLVALAELSYATLLTDASELHEAACLRLKQLTVHILFGEAALMLRPPEAPEPPQELQLKIEPLKIELIQPLQSATLKARVLLQKHRQLFQPASGNLQNPPVQEESPNSGTKPVVDESQESAVSSESAPTEVPAYDLEGLVSSAMSFSEDLEQRWSEALSKIIETGDFEQETAKWSSLMKSLLSSANRRELLLRSVGIDTTVPVWPLPPEGVAKLRFDASPDVEVMQDSVAHLYVIQQLAESVGRLSAPTKRTIDLKTGRWTDWWQAGAFDAVRNAARLALRSVEDLRRIEVGLDRTTPPKGDVPAEDVFPQGSSSGAVSQGRQFRYLQAAELAERAGLPEAVLLYSKLATDAREDSSGTSSSSRIREAARITDEVLNRLSRGEPVGLGLVIPTAHLALENAAASLGLGRYPVAQTDGVNGDE